MKSWPWMVTLLGFAGMACAQTRPVLVELSAGEGADALTAHYTLPIPVVEFRLNETNAAQREETWSPRDSGWVFDGTVIRRADGAAFTGFDLLVHPDRRFVDRHFVAVDRIGESGWAIYLEAFRAADLATRLRIAPRREQVVRDGATRSGRTFEASLGGRNRVVYFGPAKYIRTGPVTVVAGEEIPTWLIEHLRVTVGAAVTRLTDRFGALDHQPTLIVTYSSKQTGSNFKGSTLANGVIHLSLRGLRIDVPDDSISSFMTNTAIHESVHLWNGYRWASSGHEQPWLHEGSAEYLAARLWRTPEDLRAEANRRLNSCLDRKDRRPMNGSAGQVAGQAPYDCGFVIQLFAEAAARNATRPDIFDLWKTVFARTVNNEYSPESFLAEAGAAGPGFAELAAAMLGDPDAIDGAQLMAGLRRIGIAAVERRPEGPELRNAAIRSVLDSVCTGSRGFTTAADRLILDTGNRCGNVLAGDPSVVSVNGADLMRAPAQAFEAMRAACSAGDPLIFARPDGTQLDPFPCNVSVQTPAPVMQLTALPDFR